MPSGEQVAESCASGGDEPFVVASARRCERDRAVVSAVDEEALPELLERCADRLRVVVQLLRQLRFGYGCTLAGARRMAAQSLLGALGRSDI